MADDVLSVDLSIYSYSSRFIKKRLVQLSFKINPLIQLTFQNQRTQTAHVSKSTHPYSSRFKINPLVQLTFHISYYFRFSLRPPASLAGDVLSVDSVHLLGLGSQQLPDGRLAERGLCGAVHDYSGCRSAAHCTHGRKDGRFLTRICAGWVNIFRIMLSILFLFYGLSTFFHVL